MLRIINDQVPGHQDQNVPTLSRGLGIYGADRVFDFPEWKALQTSWAITANFLQYIKWTYDKSMNNFFITNNFLRLEGQHRVRTLCENQSVEYEQRPRSAPASWDLRNVKATRQCMVAYSVETYIETP